MGSKDAIAAAVNAYAVAAREHGIATEAGNPKRANQAHDTLYACLREIRTLGNGDVTPLKPLCDHEDRAVRAWAATHLLYYLGDPHSVEVLERVEAEHGLVGFDAGMVLRLWRTGELKLPPGFE